jgi:tRNA threonylcarbamoyladenosine biosynthesis protein TsaB
VKIDALPAPDINWVAWLGAAVNPASAPARPFYLRPPDAKPSLGEGATQPQGSS